MHQCRWKKHIYDKIFPVKKYKDIFACERNKWRITSTCGWIKILTSWPDCVWWCESLTAAAGNYFKPKNPSRLPEKPFRGTHSSLQQLRGHTLCTGPARPAAVLAPLSEPSAPSAWSSFLSAHINPRFTFNLFPHPLPAVYARFERVSTVSWRPTLAFSTAFWREALRCFASEIWKTVNRSNVDD